MQSIKPGILYSVWKPAGAWKSAPPSCDAAMCARRATSVSSLMYVKEDLIIPQHISFYDLIVGKARGKSGPLFHFDVHEDIRLVNDASREKDESHAGNFLCLQAFGLSVKFEMTRCHASHASIHHCHVMGRGEPHARLAIAGDGQNVADPTDKGESLYRKAAGRTIATPVACAGLPKLCISVCDVAR